MVQPLFFSAVSRSDDQAQLTFRSTELVIRQANLGDTAAWPYAKLRLVDIISGTDGVILCHDGNDVSRLKVFERHDRDEIFKHAKHLRFAHWRKTSILLSILSPQAIVAVTLLAIGLIYTALNYLFG